jgi:hypothetical protein
MWKSIGLEPSRGRFRDGRRVRSGGQFDLRLVRMPSYEYRTEVLTHGFMGRKEDELDRSELDKRLNALGADGWELEKLLTRMALHGEKDGHLLIFKRERP